MSRHLRHVLIRLGNSAPTLHGFVQAARNACDSLLDSGFSRKAPRAVKADPCSDEAIKEQLRCEPDCRHAATDSIWQKREIVLLTVACAPKIPAF